MPIHKTRQLPKIGETFTRIYAGKNYTLKVVENVNGIAYSLLKKEYRSPSAAAKAITKMETNGWIFWGID